MSLLNTEAGKEITKKVTLKNVKTGFGHDLAGMYADFYLHGEKMGYLNDDGWGGEVEINYVSDINKKVFEKFLIDNNVAQIMVGSLWKQLIKLICIHKQKK